MQYFIVFIVPYMLGFLSGSFLMGLLCIAAIRRPTISEEDNEVPTASEGLWNEEDSITNHLM
jgi:hypothetical protein